MPYRPYKIENGGHDNPFEKYLRKIKAAFVMLFLFGMLVLGMAVINFGGVARDLGGFVRFNLSSLAYALEFSKFNFVNGIAIKNGGTAVSVPVLVYHGILKKPDGSDINTTVDQFKDHLFRLKNEGYSTITTDDLYKFMKGEIDLPERSVMITFDDGRYDSYYNADPILGALGYGAVMFAVSSYSLENEKNNSYYILGEDIKRMEESGRWDVQAHTHGGHDEHLIDDHGGTAPFFGSLEWISSENRIETDEEFRFRIRDDMAKVKDVLEAELAKKISGFAIPFGDYGQHGTNPFSRPDIFLSEAFNIYPLLFFQDAPEHRFTSNYKLEKSRGQSSFLIKRVIVEASWSADDLASVLEASEAKKLPFTSDFANKYNWINPWGSLTMNSSADDRLSEVILNSGSEGGGAAVILDGTRAWKNYLLRAELLVPNRNSAFVWVRYQNDNNNAGCNLGRGFIHVEQVVNGVKRVIKGVRDPSITVPAGEFEMGVVVRDRHIGCLIDGELMVETNFLDQALDAGGVGFKTWDDIPGRGLLIVKNLKVEPL